MKIHILFFWVVTLCSQDGSTRFLQNIQSWRLDSVCSSTVLCPSTEVEGLIWVTLWFPYGLALWLSFKNCEVPRWVVGWLVGWLVLGVSAAEFIFSRQTYTVFIVREMQCMRKVVPVYPSIWLQQSSVTVKGMEQGKGWVLGRSKLRRKGENFEKNADFILAGWRNCMLVVLILGWSSLVQLLQLVEDSSALICYLTAHH
jgi:hypothetical protein